MDKSELLRQLRLKGFPFFVKTTTTVRGFSEAGRRPKSLSLPQALVRYNRMEELKFVKLRSQQSTKPWKVTLCVSIHPDSRKVRQVKLTTGWLSFAKSHHLRIRDELVFVVMAKDQFDVYVFHKSTAGAEMKALAPSPPVAPAVTVAAKQFCTHHEVGRSEKKEKTSSIFKTDREGEAHVIPPSAVGQHQIGPSSYTLSSMVDVSEEPQEALNSELEKDVTNGTKEMDIDTLAVDIKELEDAYVYVADMAGPRSDWEIQVKTDENVMLVIGGSRKCREESEPAVKLIQMERNHGRSFVRKLKLPENAHTDKIGANLDDTGVFTITVGKIPSPEFAKPRIIEVTMGSN